MGGADTCISRQIMLQRGAACTLHGVPGMVVVCAEGSVRRIELVPRGSECSPQAVAVTLCPGESYVCEQLGPVHLLALAPARLLCVQLLPWWRVLVRRWLRGFANRAMIANIRRGVEQSGSSSGS